MCLTLEHRPDTTKFVDHQKIKQLAYRGLLRLAGWWVRAEPIKHSDADFWGTQCDIMNRMHAFWNLVVGSLRRIYKLLLDATALYPHHLFVSQKAQKKDRNF